MNRLGFPYKGNQTKPNRIVLLGVVPTHSGVGFSKGNQKDFEGSSKKRTGLQEDLSFCTATSISFFSSFFPVGFQDYDQRVFPAYRTYRISNFQLTLRLPRHACGVKRIFGASLGSPRRNCDLGTPWLRHEAMRDAALRLKGNQWGNRKR